ncbi:ESPR-type extended signal peptide-containing protein, partial [Kingella potus]|uniref:ESPR-type extended signal peptide-containing protein n=1 Tax=Kingella potus TaxID=265175 RepID=UPI003D24C589
MNRIYKVIWNNDTAEWVAASELAHAKGKSKSASRTRLAALGLSALLAGTASAAIPEGTTAGPTDVAAGTGSEAKGSNSAAYGANAAANQVSATALGAAAAAGESATAVGASSKAAGTRSVAVGSGADAQAGDTVAVGGKAQASAQNAIAIGKEASVRAATAADLPSGITAAQTGQTTGMGSVAVGANAKAYGTNSTAFGQASNALGQNSFAGGQAAKAYGKSSVALGDGARADNDAAAAVGTSSRAANGGASAFGYAAHAAGFGASAFGRQAQALGNADISIGDNAGKNRKDFGTNNGGAGVYFSDGKLSSPAAAIATHTNIAIGKEAAANSGGIRNIAVGSGAGISHFGEDSVDIGTNANNFKANGAADGTKTDTPTRARYTVAVGSNAMTYGDNAVALGSGAKAKHSDALALGSASETEDAVATTSATVGGISYGGFAGSSPAANASIGSNTVKRTLTNVAAGRISATSTDAVNGSQLYAVADTLSGRLTRYYSVKSSATGAGSNYDNDGATGNNALAAGVKASASALNTVAVGYNAQAGRDGAVSVGADTKATSASTALGNGANAAGENSTALGWGAYAAGRADVFVGKKAGEGTEDSNNFSNIGIGEGAVKDAGKTTAVTNIIGIGTGAAVGLESSHNIALGAYSNNKLVTGTAVTGSDNIAVGQRTIATGGGSIAVGTKAQASDLSAVAVGLNAVAQGQQAVALGRNTKAAGAGSVAVGGSANDGKGAAANGSQSVAIGQLSNAATTGASALGVNAQAAHQKGVALGYESATEANVTTTAATINGISYSGFAGAANANVSIGKSGFTRTLTNVAAGRISATSTDAVNGSQLYAVAGTLSDRLTRYYSVKSSATGAGSNYNNDGATGADALAAGVGASAQQTSSVAIGKNAVAEGNAAVSDSIAVGTGAKASGNASLAIGPGASTSGSDSLGGIAIGAAATSKNGGLSLGSGADSGNGTALIPGMPVRLNNNVALGDSATVKDNTNFRVALGSMSIAGVSDLDAAPYKPSANAQVKGIAASGVTLGEVSVGGDNRAGLGQILYRRITNLAAGSEDTDAVNVSQLKALAAAGTKVVGAGLAGVSSDTDKAGATTYTVNVAQAATPNVTRGNVTVAAGDAGKVMTAGDVAAAINKSEKTSSVTAGSAAVSVKAGKEDAAGNTQYTVDLGTAAKASLAKADSAVQNIVSSSPNLSANKSGDTVTIGMSENPVFTSVRTGDTLLNGSGLTIAPAGKNPVVLNSDGLNNGGNKITNVGKGTVSDTSTEAVNGSQLYALAEKPLTFTGDSGSVNRKLGETLGIKGDGTYVSTKAQNGSVNITVSENAVRDAARKA